MITLIAAVAANGAIGKDNQLLWRIPEDMKRFKEVTSGHAVIMGRKTFDSLPQPLKNRINIVITRNPNYRTPEGILIAHSLDESFEIAKQFDSNPYVLGGGRIYHEAIEQVDFLDITHIDKEFQGDAYFPEIDPNIWQIEAQSQWFNNEQESFNYRFVSYGRKNNNVNN